MTMRLEDNEIVSVVIIVYNEQKTIKKTLESIYRQSYPWIEVIVQDDCSTDGTVGVVRDWVQKVDADNKFVRFVINSNATNQGTAVNANEGCKLANGKWVKVIGGDDFLFDDCIKKNVEFAHTYTEDILIVSDVVGFYEKNEEIIIQPYEGNVNHKRMLSLNETGAKKQYKMLLKHYNVNAPTFFFTKNGWREIGGYDTRYGLMEDWPFVIRWTQNGKCLRYLETPTVYYRMGDPGTTKTGNFFNISHLRRIERFKRDEVYPNISKWDIAYWLSEGMIKLDQYIMIKCFDNKMTHESTIINYCLTWLVPYFWGQKFRNLRIHKMSGLRKQQKWNLREDNK